jgi:uncharacterized protein
VNASLLDQWYAAVKIMDPVALAAITTDDVVVLWNGDSTVIPWAGRHVGRDASLACFQTLADHIEVLSIAPVDRFATADAAIVTLDGRWRVRDSEIIIAARACNVFRFRGGKIAAYEVYNDTAPFAAALASLPR